MENYTRTVNTQKNPQSEPIFGRQDMVKGPAGGYVFPVSDWTRLERFLILGSDSNTFYEGKKKLTMDNAEAVVRCISEDGQKVVKAVVEISDAGRASNNDPALFVLAMAASFGDEPTKRFALASLHNVARIPTHLFHFAEFVDKMRGWGPALRNAFNNWYLETPADKVAYHIAKYPSRDGWSHRDIFRKSHPQAEAGSAHQAIFAWVTQQKQEESLPEIFAIREEMFALDPKDDKAAVKMITDHNLTREMVPTEFLASKRVWEALVQKMPMTATLRNLGKLSNIGLLDPMSDTQTLVARRLRDAEAIKKSRIHPLNVLVALKTYASGGGYLGKLTWAPNQRISGAMNEMFYAAFANVEPTGKRVLLGVDVSGSMSQPVASKPMLSAREAAAALAMVTARTEENSYILGFTGQLIDLQINPTDSLENVMEKTRGLRFGRTDCSLPMQWATDNKVQIDAFGIITDNETWYGNIHPSQALQQYRKVFDTPAKLYTAAMTSAGRSIADPKDGGMLDIVGFDSFMPQLIHDFIAD